MLSADQLHLRARIKQNTVGLKVKEFALYQENFTAVGTQAAMLAGFTVTALIEFGPPADASRVLKFCFYNLSMLSLAANMVCVASTTVISVFGSSLSMRGPDGSMTKCVDNMYVLREKVYNLFGIGLLSLLVSCIFGSWILLEAIGVRRARERRAGSKSDTPRKTQRCRRPPRPPRSSRRPSTSSGATTSTSALCSTTTSLPRRLEKHGIARNARARQGCV
ncbi:hypothetical protein M885DRAFT_269893 [Pelagophyceae sp. CCMP2097]|nr:hypothetical protein M885DRAFT_269893 [Pelagophyceae sp. CCMP2097]